MFQLLDILQTKEKDYYRARPIDLLRNVDKGKGITRIENRLVGGFDSKNSGIASPELCKAGRLNREGETVFYISEDPVTSLMEMKPTSNTYFSLATFSAKKYLIFLSLLLIRLTS